MPRDTLLDFFEDFSTLDDTFVVHDDGYRARSTTYREMAAAARAFATRLQAAAIQPDEKVIIWSENRTEWLVALWGCLLARVVLVPVDFRASADLLERIALIVKARVVLVGNDVQVPPSLGAPTWHLDELAIDRAMSSAAGVSRPQPSTGADRQDQADRPVDDARPTGATLAEIIFTSGATADPKGVTITHRNLLANIIPIEREIKKYKRYARPFHPLRFLNLLPLSHMFGQSMATFVPPILGGTVVFSHGYSPTEILRQVKTRRISVLVCVPKVLDVLREHVQRISPITAGPDVLAGKHWAWRWWHYREVHRLFGWKFWCIVCGAAPLDSELEAFWRKLGFLVVQGYGLTETAPIVTLNHPLRASKGTVGTPIGGVEVKIADDGEILVRGDNVTSGYYQAEGADGASAAGATSEPSAFRDGWFHTGDIGELDASGRLLIKGRKKEMIVTPQGLNVFPEDVERALTSQPGVRDAAVVGVTVEGEERIHGVLVLDPGAQMDAIIRGANAGLEDHQRVWRTLIWPSASLPRTEGTQKLKRREVQRWAAGEQAGVPPRVSTGTRIEDIVGRYAAGREITAETTLDELGLSSLDRVELMMALEEAFQTTLDEGALAEAKTVGALGAMVGGGTHLRVASEGSTSPAPPAGGAPGTMAPATVAGGPDDTIAFPSWNRHPIAWFLRRLSLPTWILPLARVFMQMRVDGLEHLASIRGPVVFAANHQSHMDTPAILIALPPRWRYRVAPAMAKEFFKAHFFPAQFTTKKWLWNSVWYYLACQFFNAFPLPQREGGTRQAMRYMGEILGDNYSILIFPEGRREQDAIGSFRPGIGMLGARLNVPVVPVRIHGLDKVLHPSARWPTRGPVRIAFGAPLTLVGDDYQALAKQVEDAVRELN